MEPISRTPATLPLLTGIGNETVIYHYLQSFRTRLKKLFLQKIKRFKITFILASAAVSSLLINVRTPFARWWLEQLNIIINIVISEEKKKNFDQIWIWRSKENVQKPCFSCASTSPAWPLRSQRVRTTNAAMISSSVSLPFSLLWKE